MATPTSQVLRPPTPPSTPPPPAPGPPPSMVPWPPAETADSIAFIVHHWNRLKIFVSFPKAAKMTTLKRVISEKVGEHHKDIVFYYFGSPLVYNSTTTVGEAGIKHGEELMIIRAQPYVGLEAREAIKNLFYMNAVAPLTNDWW